MSNESFNSILQSYQSISDFLKSYDFNTILSYIAHATGKKKAQLLHYPTGGRY